VEARTARLDAALAAAAALATMPSLLLMGVDPAVFDERRSRVRRISA